MKKLILYLILTFGIQSTFADCASSGMRFFPQQKKISLNSMFIIEGYESSVKTIEGFRSRRVFLQSSQGDLVELNLLQILKGQMRLAQAIFKPVQELQPNTTYFLKYSDQTDNETNEMMQWNSEKNEREKVYWETTDKKKNPLLNSDLSIEYEKLEVIHFGCGPSANAIFNLINRADSETWFKTEVVDLSTDTNTIYYIKEWYGKVNVGHGMCFGAFTFNREAKYKVRFTPMNNDGEILTTSNWIFFDSPFVNN